MVKIRLGVQSHASGIIISIKTILVGDSHSCRRFRRRQLGLGQGPGSGRRPHLAGLRMVVHRQGKELGSGPRHHLPSHRGSLSKLQPDVVRTAGNHFQHGGVRTDRRFAEYAGAHVRLRQSLARHRQARHATGDSQSCRSQGQKGGRHGWRPASDHDGHLPREERSAVRTRSNTSTSSWTKPRRR